MSDQPDPGADPAVVATQVGEGGEQVVFLHGLFGQGRNFTQIAKALRPELSSLLVDLPNHGRSAWTQSADYLEVADALARWLRELPGPAVRRHLVGHSMGGKVAMVLAVRHPDLVDRLVVVDIAPAISEGSEEFEHLLSSLAALDLSRLTSRAEAGRLLEPAIGDERVRGFLLQNLRSVPGGWHWQANLELLRRELAVIGGFPELEGRFDRPTLWVAGERSGYVQPAHSEPMRRLFPRTTAMTIKDAGHWVHSEQPEAFVQALRVFLLAGRG